MSALPWWDLPWLEDLDDEDPSDLLPVEILTIAPAGLVWWSAAPMDTDAED